MTEEKIKEDILNKRNTEDDVSGSLNSEGAKRMRMRNSSKNIRNTTRDVRYGQKAMLKKRSCHMLDSSSEDKCQETPENGSADAVPRRNCYLTAIKKRININENSLKWWTVHREELKILSTIARRFLSPPAASSVPSEQLFSIAGLIYEPLLNRFEPEKAAILLFIKYNAHIFDFTY